jgi:hypothetical protein
MLIMRTLRYESEGMAELRAILNHKGFSDDHVDSFKHCLISLEKEGFQLIKHSIASTPEDKLS